MKKLSAINENVFDDMLKRSSSDEKRTEDKLYMNVKYFKEIDLGDDIPVLFADRDLEVNGEIKFSWFETEKMIPEIEKTGWRLPVGINEMENFFFIHTYPNELKKDITMAEDTVNKNPAVVITKQSSDDELVFPMDSKYGSHYWSKFSERDLEELADMTRRMARNTARGYEVRSHMIDGCNFDRYEKCRIRLIKDK